MSNWKPIDIVVSLMNPNQEASETIGRAWKQDDQNSEDFFTGLDLVLGSMNFHFPKVPALAADDPSTSSLSFQDFYQGLKGLAGLSSDQAMERIEDLALQSNTQEWNLWYRRILMRTLPKFLPMAAIQKELFRLTM
jgi:hypothetical protein